MNRASLVLLLLAGSAWHEAAAQSALTPDQEYAKYVGKANVIDAFADFGDQVNLRDGSLAVRATDIELAGTGPTIRITRTYRPNNMGEDWHETSGNEFGFWEIEIPRIKTIAAFPVGATIYSPVGWQVIGATAAEKNARCTRFAAPGRINFAHDQARGWNAADWWSGYQLVDDSGNPQPLMSRTSPTVRTDLKLMTIGNWLVGCLSATSNGQPGEAFYALAPDGTKYWFDHLVYAQADTLKKPLWSNSPPSVAGPGDAPSSGSKAGGGTAPSFIIEFDQLERQYASMLVTRVEDRFGNWVTYHYTSGKLDSIDASDGRHVGLTFNPNGAAATVTVGSGPTARTWSYAYTGVTALTITHQLTVTRPDGSTWQYSLPVLPASALKSGAEIPAEPPCDPAPDDWDSFSEGTVISPAGATLTLRLNRKRFARSYVYKECWNKNATDPDSGYLVYPNEWYAFAVIKRTISGPGLTTAVWNYAYSAPVSSWYQDCPTPTSCASTVWTDVTDPDGNRRRSIFSNRFDETENKLLREEVYTPSSQLLRATDYAYATVAAGAANPYPWPVHVGNDMQTRVNTQTSGQWAPVRQSVVTQQGRTFTNNVNSFDAYARPTSVTKSSAP